MKRILLGFMTAAVPLLGQAQNSPIDDFQKFRSQLHADYQGFRKSVLDGYADYLNTAWKEYKAFKGEARDEKPKPVTPPDVKTTPSLPPSEPEPLKVVPRPKPAEPVKPVKPAEPVKPVLPETPTVPEPQNVPFSFYGAGLTAPKMESAGITSLKPAEVSSAWRHYQQKSMRELAGTLRAKARSLGLNDWFTYEMVRECVNAQLPQATVADRVTLQHFLLANMGFDVRLADCGGMPCLMFATQQTIYGRGYLLIDGKKYYVYQYNGKDAPSGGSLYTCELPSDVDLGSAMDMRIRSNVNMTVQEMHHCKLEYNGITVTGDVDVRLMEMLRRYPQMDVVNYAMSNLSPSLHESVLEQLRPHIEGLPVDKAANLLLRFVQHAFDYATDGNQHGYEKAYFFEENFYYPKNDCEDRAIFYAYLVRNLLDLDVHLIQFPGHECTAVNFKDVKVHGTGYIYEDRTFVICDPTYIGASIGQCMPEYRDVAPKIELWY